MIYHLPEGNYRCRECSRVKPWNYFISETLCKKCAAKRWVSPSNDLVATSFGLKVTEAVLRRIHRRADRIVPRALRDHIAPFMPPIFAAIGISGYFLAVVSTSISLGPLLFIPLLVVPVVVGVLVMQRLSRPRNQALDAAVARLAKDRQEQIDAMQAFYASAEWVALRRQILNSSEPICGHCRQRIRKAFDLTVDHIKPRSNSQIWHSIR